MPSSYTDVSLWARYLRTSTRFRVGVISDSDQFDWWASPVLRALPPQVEIELAGVFLLPSQADARAKPPWLFDRLQRWSGTATPIFAPTETVTVDAPVHRLSGMTLSEQDRQAIQSAGLDLLLCASTFPFTGDSSNVARLGVWSLLFGRPEFAGFRPPCWREVFEGHAVTDVFLLAHPERFERGRLIESIASATVPSLRFTQNQALPIEAAAALLGRNLIRAAVQGNALPSGEEIRLNPDWRWPTSAETLRFAANKLGRSAALHLQARGKENGWFVAIRSVPVPNDFRNVEHGERFLEIAAPPGHYYADPFLVERDGRHWLFVEDWVDRDQRGCLACLEIRDGRAFGEAVPILEKPYHLSYPHIIAHCSEYFMIPESSADGTVQLYRATKYPFEWKLESVLFEGAALVDTTAFHHGGNWYFFTSPSHGPQETYLFTAQNIDGPWRYHAANPICSDTRRVRGAGAIFEWEGGWIRPSQDCSLGYGYALAFNEIRRLSPDEYEERRIAQLLPTWAPALTGTHTFNFDSKYQVVDGQRLQPRSKR